MSDFRFCFQDNQFRGECLPCTASQFKTIVNSTKVNSGITTRQAVEKAISTDQPLDAWQGDNDFLRFCSMQEQKTGDSFTELPVEKKLSQWVNSLKMNLPCFIFAVREFEAVPKTDKAGNLVLDENGNEVLFRQRKQSNILELSGLFMFDADHLPMAPGEVYERTKKQGFPWKVRLAHVTSSGGGLRLVSEAIPEVGNIADNQIELARELGLLGLVGTTGKPVTDDSCIDASRISYAPRMCDIYYVDEDGLFNYKGGQYE